MIVSSGISQLILIATTPLISRLYSPSEFENLQYFLI